MKNRTLVLLPFIALLASTSSGFAAPQSARYTTYQFSGPSVIGFSACAFLHDFKGETSHLQGKFELDLADLAQPGRGSVEIEAKTLNTQNARRDRVMRQRYLETQRYPDIYFVIRKAALDSKDDAEKKADYILEGELSLHGVKQSIRFLATLDYHNPRNLKIVGTVPIYLADFRIPIPSKSKIIRVKNQVVVSFELTAVPSL